MKAFSAVVALCETTTKSLRSLRVAVVVAENQHATTTVDALSLDGASSDVRVLTTLAVESSLNLVVTPLVPFLTVLPRILRDGVQVEAALFVAIHVFRR
jgi:hypothetical protein